MKKKPNGCKCPACDPNRSTNLEDYLPKNHIGRPLKYDPKTTPAKAIEILSEGHSLAAICKEMQIDYDTIAEWRKRFPEFSRAVKKGLAYCEDWWVKEGRANRHNNKFNTTIWYMNMKNRFKWHDQKPAYATKEIPGFEGKLAKKTVAIDKALKSGILSVDEYGIVMQSLAHEAKIIETCELAQDMKVIQESLGIKKQ